MKVGCEIDSYGNAKMQVGEAGFSTTSIRDKL